jgi:thioredoxin 1
MEITIKDFQKEVLQSELPVLVEFWASWCLPCQTAKPLLEEINKEYDGRVKIVAINLDRNPLISERYQIKGLPTFALFKNGREIQRKVGAQSKDDLHTAISNLLSC